ncbi:MAG: hypothetical protein KDA77_13990 [Planctomycetaceae bacterium]|nr:hypothetical protein [Planctomycetaceae bacterium]
MHYLFMLFLLIEVKGRSMVICNNDARLFLFLNLSMRSLLFCFLITACEVCSADDKSQTTSPEERLESLRTLMQSAQTPQQAFEVSVVGLDLADDLIEQKLFSEASKAAAISKTAAKKADSTYLYQSSVYYSKYALGLDADYQEIEKSIQALKTDPNNRDAALAVGLFYCFNNWDWSKGLPLLKQCSDASLVALANRELEFPSVAADQIKLGDLWASYAAEGDPQLKTVLLQRAKYWYLKALSRLPAVEQASLVKRINRIPKKSFQLNIAVRIDGSDTLTLSEDKLTWRNHSYQFPSVLIMNGIEWKTTQAQVLANQGGTRVLPHHIHLTSVRLKKQRGRGPVSLKTSENEIQITFDDSKPAGANDYVIVLSFDSF